MLITLHVLSAPNPLPFSLYSFSPIVICMPINLKSKSPGQISGAETIITASYCPSLQNSFKSTCPKLNCYHSFTHHWYLFLSLYSLSRLPKPKSEMLSSPSPVVLNQGWFFSLCPKGHLAMSGGLFGSQNLGDGGLHVIDISWVEVRDAAQYLTMHRTDPHNKNDPAKSATSTVSRLKKPELIPPPGHPCPIIVLSTLSPKYLLILSSDLQSYYHHFRAGHHHFLPRWLTVSYLTPCSILSILLPLIRTSLWKFSSNLISPLDKIFQCLPTVLLLE